MGDTQSSTNWNRIYIYGWMKLSLEHQDWERKERGEQGQQRVSEGRTKIMGLPIGGMTHNAREASIYIKSC